jgi:hypothetical protein
VSSHPRRVGAINSVTYQVRRDSTVPTKEIVKITFFRPFSWIPDQDKADGQNKIHISILLAFVEQGYLSNIRSGKHDSERVSKALRAVTKVRESGGHQPERDPFQQWTSSQMGLQIAATDSDLSEDRKIPIPTHVPLQAPETTLFEHPSAVSLSMFTSLLRHIIPKMAFYKTEVPDARYLPQGTTTPGPARRGLNIPRVAIRKRKKTHGSGATKHQHKRSADKSLDASRHIAEQHARTKTEQSLRVDIRMREHLTIKRN